MKILLLDKTNSRFVTITAENLRRYGLSNFVWDYELNEYKIIELITEGQLGTNPDYNPVLWLLYEHLGKPGNFQNWIKQLHDKVEKQLELLPQ